MKPISEELRNRLKTEDPSPELVLELLKETSPDEYCTRHWCEGEFDNPDKCCILGRIGYEVSRDPVYSLKAEHYRSMARSYKCSLSSINDGTSPKYQQATPYERVKAAMEDLIKLKQDENTEKSN